MKQTTTSEFGPLSDVSARAGLGSIGMVLIFAGALLASSYPRLAAGVLIGLAVVPLSRRAARAIVAFRERYGPTRDSGTGRAPSTRSTTHR